MRKKTNLRGGYTLIELMIVIVIIGILSSIVLPHLVKGRYQAQFSSCCFNLRAIAGALESYHTDRGNYPSNSDWTSDLLFKQAGSNPPYMTPEPLCPSNSSQYGYTTTVDGENYTVYCQGIHHLIIKSVHPGFPQYNPSVGLMATQ